MTFTPRPRGDGSIFATVVGKPSTRVELRVSASGLRRRCRYTAFSRERRTGLRRDRQIARQLLARGVASRFVRRAPMTTRNKIRSLVAADVHVLLKKHDQITLTFLLVQTSYLLIMVYADSNHI